MKKWILRGALAASTLAVLYVSFAFARGRRVVPGRLLKDGFEFRFPHWAAAAEDLCRRWRETR